MASLTGWPEHAGGECPGCEGFYCSDVACEGYGVTEHKDGCKVGLWASATREVMGAPD